MKTVTLYLSMDEAKELLDELEELANNLEVSKTAEALILSLGHRIEAADEV